MVAAGRAPPPSRLQRGRTRESAERAASYATTGYLPDGFNGAALVRVRRVAGVLTQQTALALSFNGAALVRVRRET